MTPAPSEPNDTVGGDEPPLTLGAWLVRNSFSLLVSVAIIALLAYKFDAAELGNIAKVVIGLGLVIFLHELGHFAVAKWCDVHVQTFSIGFGPALPGCSFQKGETTYMIALFPLGGYVKMVGEGDNPEDDVEDPRSFKNKTVGQRMAIISAGVIMNVILGGLCFIFVYMTKGMERAPGIIGRVDAGSPAWISGIQSGMVIKRIASTDDPMFDDVAPAVMLTRADQAVHIVLAQPGGKPLDIDIMPRRDPTDPKPVIGVLMPEDLRLVTDRRKLSGEDRPVLTTSAAAHSEPPFEFNDVIVGSNGADQKLDAVSALPPDPRNPGGLGDYFEFRRREVRMAGKPMMVRVRRRANDRDTEVDIKVPPAWHWTFGARMRMGKVSAIRENSPAAEAGLEKGDIIKSARVVDGQGTTLLEVAEDDLDPVKLPVALKQAAAGHDGVKIVLKVLRPNPGNHEEKDTTPLTLRWDDSWHFDREVPLNMSSPLPIAELGAAYQIEPTIKSVAAGSPAEQAGLKPGDAIIRVRGRSNSSREPEPTWGFWTSLTTKGDEPEPWWAAVDFHLQLSDSKELQLEVRRGNALLSEPVTVTAIEDTTWPEAERGILLMSDVRWETADSPSKAVMLGMRDTYRVIVQIYLNLRGLATRRLSTKNLMGPLSIATTAYTIAGQDFYRLIFFLGMISINLAVVNFLPIPLLDGGHMVFLIYEALRGKPASEQVRVATAYVGLFLLLSLMGFAIYLDVMRKWFGL
jgi:regulator of sigma E protease